MTIAIREANPRDIEVVIDVWRNCELTRPWNDPANDFNLAMNSSPSTIFLAEDSNGLVATVMTGFDGHRGWVYYLGVLPNSRGQGIANQLLNTATMWLTERNCPKVELMVRSDNPVSDFYMKNGWEKQDVEVYARWLNKKDK